VLQSPGDRPGRRSSPGVDRSISRARSRRTPGSTPSTRWSTCTRYEREDVAGIVVDGAAVDVTDPTDEHVVDPAAVKREALESATEAATMILRIDDVIAAN